MKHMWQRDWHQYLHQGTRVMDSGVMCFCIYTAARIGEYYYRSGMDAEEDELDSLILLILSWHSEL